MAVCCELESKHHIVKTKEYLSNNNTELIKEMAYDHFKLLCPSLLFCGCIEIQSENMTDGL